MKKEIKIALVAILGLVILFFGMNYLKGLNIFSTDTKYYMSFSDISGLTSSSPIYADGYKVGVVKHIDYDYEHPGDIKIEAGIDPSLRIPKGSTAEIVSDLLGNVQVNLMLGDHTADRLEEGGIIEGAILKAHSPSCGNGKIYDGTFTRTLTAGDGVFAALLKAHGIPVYTEEDGNHFGYEEEK